jgi:hypothetical protein
MKGKVRSWGLDVHAEAIAVVAIAEPDGANRALPGVKIVRYSRTANVSY